MDTNQVCPGCQKPLPPDVPLELCPECLIKAGFNTGTEPGGEGAGFIPPPVGQLTSLFPQLEIIEIIGRGGMGAVYRARQPALDRFVALKILPPRTSSGPAFADRFNREARALARLTHPNIVAVHDFGQAGGLHYLVMEFVDGANLREVERAGRLAPEQAQAIVPQICEALQFAHNEGVVHRDIKPENILIDKKGRVKITDFGIAKILGAPGEKASLTGARDVIGTPHYMAPEQVERPSLVDHRADIFSLGVVFYEMLTGELPLGKFQRPSQMVKMDVRLDEVVLHALEKEPGRRYQHVSEVKTQVETIAGSAASPPAEPAVAHGGATNKLTNKSMMVRLVEAWFDITFVSPLAIKLINISASGHLGFLGCLGFLGNAFPAWRCCFGFFAFFGFFGLIGVAFIVEIAQRRKAEHSGAGAAVPPSPAKKQRPAWKEYFLCALAVLPMLACWFLAYVFLVPKIKELSSTLPAGVNFYERLPLPGFFAWMTDHWKTNVFLSITVLVILAELVLPFWRRRRRLLAWTVVALINGATLITLIGVLALSLRPPSPPEVIRQVIRNQVARQLRESGASYDDLQVTVAEERDSATPFAVSYRGLRNFKFTHDGLPDPNWPASANGQFLLQYVGGGQWKGALGDTPFAVQVGKTDNIDLPFVNDPDVLGEWKSVDFVADKSEFDPNAPKWKGELFWKGLTFLENGQTLQPYYTWTKGVLIHHDDKTASHYEIQKLNGRRYLFVECKNGDVMILGRKPELCVMRWSGAAGTLPSDGSTNARSRNY